MPQEQEYKAENVSKEELAMAVLLIRAARRQLEGDVEGHSVGDADAEQHFTDINIC
jgi:hypothetical protein